MSVAPPGLIENPAPPVPSDAGRRIRLGHAYWSSRNATDVDDIEEVLRVVQGSSTLKPRPATESAVVSAESLLGIADRPVYAFCGCLHPKLGTIGLIIGPGYLDRPLLGVSRCDSGGLVGRIGDFVHVAPEDVAPALRRLSFEGRDLAWMETFSQELAESYSTARHYVAGDVPNRTTWSHDDVRRAASSSTKQL